MVGLRASARGGGGGYSEFGGAGDVDALDGSGDGGWDVREEAVRPLGGESWKAGGTLSWRAIFRAMLAAVECGLAVGVHPCATAAESSSRAAAARCSRERLFRIERVRYHEHKSCCICARA